jgi:hypothetical protein
MDTPDTPLIPRLLRKLHVRQNEHPRGQAHLSAASGLVCLGKQALVVADDEHHWGRFSLEPTQLHQPVELLRCLPGDLPTGAKPRKCLKADFESLCVMPAFREYPQGALLSLGSGSKDPRHWGVMTGLTAQGDLPEAALSFNRMDLKAWYAPLQAQFTDLNIEGCFIQTNRLHLIQRGNKGDSSSACISYWLADVLAWLGHDAPAPSVLEIRPLDFGRIQDIPLTPTDAIALPDGRWLMSAVAENTSNSVQDGACLGSALVLLNAQAQVQRLMPLAGAPKVEGICLLETHAPQVLMVTDADDPEQASQLLQLDLSWL